MPRNFSPTSRLVDLGVVCLICLRAEPGYCSIYGQDLETPHMQILDKIRSCSALQLERSQLTQFPDLSICHGCRNELSITYRFQQKCFEAHKVFQSAATATLLLDVDKLELEQAQQLKLPTSLKIKRLETEPDPNKVIKYFNDDDDDDIDDDDVSNGVTLMHPENAAANVVLQDVTVNVSDNEDDKLLELDVDWANDQTDQMEEQPEQKFCKSEQDVDQELELELDQSHILNHEDDDYTLPDEQSVVDTLATPFLPSNTNNNNNINISNNNNNITNNNNTNIQHVALRNRRPAEPKICDICGNTYKYQHALNAHMRRHNNDRPYPCEVCQKAFISNVELRRHMRVHTGQKPYGCHYCERRFSDFGSSKKHERIHTGERPYVCEVCNKGFAYAHVLSVHRRTHTGKKQFQCTQCDKGFTKKCYLVTHMEQHRNVADSTLRVGAMALKLPIRNRQQQDKKRLDRRMSSENSENLANCHPSIDADDDDYDDEDAVMGMRNLNQISGEQTKVLEECIVTNDFMFNDEDGEEPDPDLDNYHDTELDENDFQSVQHVKVPYGLVGDLLDTDLAISDTKYLME